MWDKFSKCWMIMAFLIGPLFSAGAADPQATGAAEPKEAATAESVHSAGRESAADVGGTEADVKQAGMETLEETRQRELQHLDARLEHLRRASGSGRILSHTIVDVSRALDVRALSVLGEILSHNPRAVNRAAAARAMGDIQLYNDDKQATPALVEALGDSFTEVRLSAAKALVLLGCEPHVIDVLTQMARGDDRGNWAVDWAGFIRLENVTEEELAKQKAKYKAGCQREAISLLGMLPGEAARTVLADVAASADDPEMRAYARSVLERTQGRLERGASEGGEG
jgi:hypothetical protein